MDDDPLTAVAYERERQDNAYPDQRLPDGTYAGSGWRVDLIRMAKELAIAQGDLSWVLLVGEEFAEVIAEVDEAKLEVELSQLAALCVRWIADIRRRREGR